MMLNNSSHPPLCLNCRKPIDLEGSVFQLLSVQKLLLFQTYAEQLKVNQSPKIPTWWDFCDEDLPFCESCFQAVKHLRQLTRQLDGIQRNIHEIITNFKIQILSSEKQRHPASYHRYRDSIFRNLAVADFLPEISLPKVKIEQEERRTSLRCVDNRLKTDVMVDSSVLQPSDQIFDVAGSPAKDLDSYGKALSKCSTALDPNPEIDSQRTARLPRLLKRQNEVKLSNYNSTLSSKSRSYSKWTEKRNGQTFISGIELVRMGNGQYKCGECQKVLKNRRYFLKHVQYIHLGFKRSYKVIPEKKRTRHADSMKIDPRTDRPKAVLTLESTSPDFASNSNSTTVETEGNPNNSSTCQPNQGLLEETTDGKEALRVRKRGRPPKAGKPGQTKPLENITNEAGEDGTKEPESATPVLLQDPAANTPFRLHEKWTERVNLGIWVRRMFQDISGLGQS